MFETRQSSDATPPCFKWVSGIHSQKQDRTHHSLTGVVRKRNRGRTDAPDDWTSSISLAHYLELAPVQRATALCSGLLLRRQTTGSSSSHSHMQATQPRQQEVQA